MGTGKVFNTFQVCNSICCITVYVIPVFVAGVILVKSWAMDFVGCFSNCLRIGFGTMKYSLVDERWIDGEMETICIPL
jgi:hypothetical protein